MDNEEFLTQQQKLIALCPDVENIMFALTQYLSVSYFRYVKSYPDNTKLILCSNAEWLEKYFSEEFYDTELANFHKHPPHSHGISIHGECHDNHPVCDFWNRHASIGKYDHIMGFYTKFDNYFEMYDFGLSAEAHTANNLFLNNQKIFKHFFLYFKSRGQDLLAKAEALRFPIKEAPEYDQSKNWLLGMNDSLTKIIIQEMRLLAVFLDDELEGTSLTINQAKTLKLFIEGYTFSEAPKTLGISEIRYKTLLQEVMNKLGATTFFELRNLCHQKHISKKLGFLDAEKV
tara:strand:- start:67463 stop:68326 length:864 start_codon:yes stop_codon:yes gene_type:complete